jgi:hypothetical protein
MKFTLVHGFPLKLIISIFIGSSLTSKSII